MRREKLSTGKNKEILVRYLYKIVQRQAIEDYGSEDKFIGFRLTKLKMARGFLLWVTLRQIYEFMLKCAIQFEEVDDFIRKHNLMTPYSFYGQNLGWRCTRDQYVLIAHYCWGKQIRAAAKELESKAKGQKKKVCEVGYAAFDAKCGEFRVVTSYLMEKLGYKFNPKYHMTAEISRLREKSDLLLKKL